MKIATSITVALVLHSSPGEPARSVVAGDGRNISKVNGSVKAAAGETYDKVSTVNGNVHVDRGATVNEAETVNGEIVIEEDAKVGDGQHGQWLARHRPGCCGLARSLDGQWRRETGEPRTRRR